MAEASGRSVRRLRSMIEGEKDRISELPADLRVKILTLLPIKDAVRTSVLSSLWKLEWASMPDLVISDGDFASSSAFVHFVDILLMLRRSPIRTVSITTSAGVSHALNRWMVMMSRNRIEEAQFMLNGSLKYQIPFSLFACVYLKKLQVSGCTVKLPPGFKGFEILTELMLENFSASDSDLGRLISSCPYLDVLTLRGFEGVLNLDICAPYLRQLDIAGHFKKLNLQTSNLWFARILLTLPRRFTIKQKMVMPEGPSNFNSAFGCCLQSIRQVVLYEYAMTYLGLQCLEDRISRSFDNLVKVTVHMNVKCPLETPAALCFFQNAPNIEFLHIRFESSLVPNSLGLKVVYSFEECSFCHLKKLYLERFHGWEEELALLKQVLLAAPSLETVEFFSFPPEDEVQSLEPELVLKKILGFSRASSKAKVIFNSNNLVPQIARFRGRIALQDYF